MRIKPDEPLRISTDLIMSKLSDAAGADYRNKLKQHSDQLNSVLSTDCGSNAHVETSVAAVNFMNSLRALPLDQQNLILNSDDAKESLEDLMTAVFAQVFIAASKLSTMS